MSHHISNNFTSSSTNNQADLTTTKADIVAIKAKTDKITIASNLNLNTISDQSLVNAVVNTTQAAQIAMTEASDMKTAIDLNTAKTGITISQTNTIIANTNGKNLNATNITNIANNSVSSNLKSAVDSNSSKNSYPSGDAAKMNKILISTSGSSVNLNSLSGSINANATNILGLQNAFPKQTTVRHLASQTADLYNDTYVKFNWDGTNKQLRFFILAIGSGEYMVGGAQIWRTTASFQTATFVSQNASTAYKYFTASQTSPSSSTINTAYNLTQSYFKVCYFLTPYQEFDYPSYEITVLGGYSFGWHTINIKRFN